MNKRFKKEAERLYKKALAGQFTQQDVDDMNFVKSLIILTTMHLTAQQERTDVN